MILPTSHMTYIKEICPVYFPQCIMTLIAPSSPVLARWNASRVCTSS